MAVVGLFFSDSLVGFFRDDPEVIAVGSVALKAQLLSLFFLPLCVCSNMMFQSIGKNSAATFLSTLRSGLVFIPVIFILSRLFGLFGIEISQTVADIAAFFLSLPFVTSFFKHLPKDGQ